MSDIDKQEIYKYSSNSTIPSTVLLYTVLNMGDYKLQLLVPGGVRKDIFWIILI